MFLQKNRAVSKKICRGNYRNICHLPYLLSTSQVDLLPWNLNCKFRSIFWVSFKFQSIGCPGKLKLSPRITLKQNITEKISKQVKISVQVIDRISWILEKITVKFARGCFFVDNVECWGVFIPKIKLMSRVLWSFAELSSPLYKSFFFSILLSAWPGFFLEDDLSFFMHNKLLSFT